MWKPMWMLPPLLLGVFVQTVLAEEALQGEGERHLEQQRLQRKLIELLQSKFDRVEQRIRRADTLLDSGDAVEAHDAIRQALRNAQEAQRASRWVQRMTGKEDQVSVIKGRILQVLVYPDVAIEMARNNENVPGWFKAVLPLFPREESIDVQVIETYTVGRERPAFFGLAKPKRRQDLVPGQTIKLARHPQLGDRQLTEGEDYWLVIGQLRSQRLANQILGGGSVSWLYIAEPIAPGKRKRI